MAAPKGHPRYGGRAKGTPNKSTQALKQILSACGLDPAKRLVTLLPELEPAKQADVLCRLLEYIYPKLKAIDIELSGEVGVSPGVSLDDLESRIKQIKGE